VWRVWRVWSWGLTLLAALSGRAAADQRRDYVLDASSRTEGTFLHVDFLFTGAQLTLEDRTQIYGGANDLTLAAGVLPTYPFGEGYVRADLRLVILQLGATAAYRTTWRGLSFAPGAAGEYCDACERGPRRAVRTFENQAFGWGEARAGLVLPFNDYVVATSTGALRYEGRPDRSFDWFYTSIYDRGILGRWESMLFLKHRSFGGIGPFLQALWLPRAGKHQAQWAGGLNFVTRVGLVPRNDLLLVSLLARPGDGLFGQHMYFSPLRAIVAYRVTLEL
jgi:hypothetical protein